MPSNQSMKKIERNGLVSDLFSFPTSMIRSVILGCKAIDEFENSVIEILKNDDEYSHAQLFKCRRSNERYEFIISQIEK